MDSAKRYPRIAPFIRGRDDMQDSNLVLFFRGKSSRRSRDSWHQQQLSDTVEEVDIVKDRACQRVVSELRIAVYMVERRLKKLWASVSKGDVFLISHLAPRG